MKSEEFNTSEMSKERIYKNVNFLWFHFSNSSISCDTIEKMKEFFSKAEEKAEKDGYVKWDVKPFYDDGDGDNLPSCSLCVTGWRLETDVEYFTRLKWKLRIMEMGYENYKKKMEYYANGSYEAQLEEVQKVVEKIELSIIWG
jgi:hypothetical protein